MFTKIKVRVRFMAKNVKKYWTLKDIRSFTMKKFETVRLLLDAGMQKEAMIYMFHILAWLIENKHDVKKAPSSTVKEYFGSRQEFENSGAKRASLCQYHRGN